MERRKWGLNLVKNKGYLMIFKQPWGMLVFEFRKHHLGRNQWKRQEADQPMNQTMNKWIKNARERENHSISLIS